MQEIEYKDGRREMRYFNATDEEAQQSHDDTANLPDVARVVTQPLTVGAAMLAAEALSLPAARAMRSKLTIGGKRIDRGRCAGCGKKPYDCRCKGKKQGA